MADDISWSFAELESALAAIHSIDETKRTAFQARLKNFHRIKYPINFDSVKGRASRYSPCQIADMALAIELTQLGLPPERTVLVLSMNHWPTSMALMMAARELSAMPEGFASETGNGCEPLSMFLYFDPAALNSLTVVPAEIYPDLDMASNSFFYGGAGIIREGIVNWTTGHVPRLSLVNVTAMLHLIAQPIEPEAVDQAEALKFRRAFFDQLAREADLRVKHWAGGEGAEGEHVWNLIEREGFIDPAQLSARLGIPHSRAELYLQHARDAEEGGLP